MSIPATARILRRGGSLIRQRRWLVHFLSFALFFAQIGMVVHASTHLKADPHASSTPQQVCGECLSFAPLQNVVGGSLDVLLPVTVTQFGTPELAAAAFVPRDAFTAFRSRAPPTLL